MKFNLTKYLIIAVCVLLALVSSMSVILRIAINEKKRLNSNQDALLTEIVNYKTKDSLNVASVKRLTLTNKEFRQYNEDLTKTVKSLNIKINQLQSVSQTATITETIIKTQIKDSLIYKDRFVRDTLKCIEYRDAFTELSGCIIGKTFEGSIVNRDTLIQAVYRERRHFLFIKFGTKGIRQEILSKNKRSKIAYSQYIEFK